MLESCNKKVFLVVSDFEQVVFYVLEVGLDPFHFLGLEVLRDPSDDGGANSKCSRHRLELLVSAVLIYQASFSGSFLRKSIGIDMSSKAAMVEELKFSEPLAICLASSMVLLAR